MKELIGYFLLNKYVGIKFFFFNLEVYFIKRIIFLFKNSITFENIVNELNKLTTRKFIFKIKKILIKIFNNSLLFLFQFAISVINFFNYIFKICYFFFIINLFLGYYYYVNNIINFSKVFTQNIV
jgi:hypothetical protein